MTATSPSVCAFQLTSTAASFDKKKTCAFRDGTAIIVGSVGVRRPAQHEVPTRKTSASWRATSSLALRASGDGQHRRWAPELQQGRPTLFDPFQTENFGSVISTAWPERELVAARSLLEDDATSPLLERDCTDFLMAGWLLMHGFVVALYCVVGSWETCMPSV